MIFETHAHYEDEQFDEDRESLLSAVKAQGVDTIVNVGSSIETTKKTIALAKQYDFIYAAIGVHPSDISDLNDEQFAWLKDQAKYQKVVAIGEIGLDYYWPKKNLELLIKEKPDFEQEQKAAMEQELSDQKFWFKKQLALAKETGLPVIIHSREAAQDTLDIMKKYHNGQTGGVIHCFSYSLELAQEYVRMGYYIGVGGVVTYKNARKLKEVVEKIPLEYILLETDCPYLAPVPNRGKRNSSLNLPYVISKIAEIKEISEDEVIQVTEQNAFRLFRNAHANK